MRLYLAVAVLMLAFVAYTEAQEDTFEQRLARFGENMSEMSKKLAEKAKATFENINNSEFAVSSRSWIEEQFNKLKTKFESK